MGSKLWRGQMGRRLPSHLSPLLALPLLSALSCADPAAPLDTADRNVVAAVISGGDPTDLGLAPYAGLISATFTQAGTIPGGARMQGAVTDPGTMPAAPNRMSAVALELTYDVTGPDSQ